MRKMLTALLFVALSTVAACGGSGGECQTDRDCGDDEVCYPYEGSSYCVPRCFEDDEGNVYCDE